jgi:hypothetical protein
VVLEKICSGIMHPLHQAYDANCNVGSLNFHGRCRGSTFWGDIVWGLKAGHCVGQVLDEAHAVKNRSAARTVRLNRQALSFLP